ncbi:MAG: glycosyltransferase [Bryobacteraceae bacterium]|jgi:GT2 family glycosyltransferase
MSAPFRFDPAAAAAEIVRALHPRRVCCAGPGADSLAGALSALGVEGVTSGPVDLAVSMGPADAATAAGLASRSGSILFAGADLPLAALRLLSGLGFLPQPDFEGGCLGGGVLFRRTGGAPGDLGAVADALESQRISLDRLGAQVSLAGRRAQDILHSRIWRTLCACGAPLLRVAALVRPTGVTGPETDSGLVAYAGWIKGFERRDDSLMRLKFRAFAQHPLVSVIVPVYRPTPADIERAIASVRAQSYSNWELCLADDGSDSPDISEILARAAAGDSRIRVTALASLGGISAASNAALALAHGEYVALLDQDDELSPDALFYAVDAINHHPGAGFFYSDEDKLDAAGNRWAPFFKPDWSPDLLLSEDYCGHLLVARRDLVERAGGFRPEYDGAQDYDLILRLSELTAEVAHIPRVLYHWRTGAGSSAADPEAKPHAAEAERRAVEDHLRRRGLSAAVVAGCAPGRLRVRYPVPPGSRAAILIPSGGHVGALRTCLESLAAKTAYPDYEVFVIDNSRGRRIERLVRSWEGGHAVRYLDWRGRPFNYSAMNNAAARECDAPLLVFLNDDVEIIEPGWLEALIELGARPEAGAIGARLLFPDGRIQHAGVALDILESGGHVFRGLDGRGRYYFDFPDVIRNVSAVTAACMLVRAAAFEQVGGFDEALFPVSFNDVDLCLRLRRLGLRNLYTPYALLRHHESLTRAPRNLTFDPAGYAALRARWQDLLDADPYYSPNLTRTSEDCSVRQGVGV